MKIGMITDSLAGMAFEELLVAAERGLDALEFACGNWSSAPHLKVAVRYSRLTPFERFKLRTKPDGLRKIAFDG